jgi:ABC-type glycerol-3-phosphate transport system substrate-binding protein
MMLRRLWPVVVVMALAVAGCGSTSSSSGGSNSASSAGSGELTVWVDSVRLPAAQAYAKAHPSQHVKIVTFDGDANGATTLQTKIQL